jgi:hypothetical protein
MKFEPKISGTRVSDFNIKCSLSEQFNFLDDLLTTIKSQKAMDYILDEFRFTRCEGNPKYEGRWYAIFDYDSLYKIAILENYPNYEKEMIEYFGENWLKHYIRFNH